MIRARRRIIAIFIVILVCIIFLLTPNYVNDDLVINDVAVLVDPMGVESIKSVSQPSRAHQFAPAPYGFSAGFKRSVHWLRFTLQAPPKNEQGKREIFLEIHPTYLDDLQIYLSQPEANGGAFEIRRAGDLQPHAAKEYPYRAFVFRVAFEDESPRTAYVRLQTTSSSVMAVKAWEPNNFITHASREYALLGLLVGVFLTGLAVNIWQGLWRQEAIYRRYIAFTAAALLNIVSVNGAVAEFLFPHAPLLAHHCVSFSTLGVVLFGVRFYMLALDIDRAPAWMQWFFRVQLFAAIICLPTPLLGMYTEVAPLLLSSASLTLLIGALRSIQLWRQRNSNGKILLLATLISLAGNISSIPTLMGVFPGQFHFIYSFQFGPFGSLMVLQFMLTQRMRTMQAKLNQATLEAELAKATAQQERAERDQQRNFLSMLTHELKTPLSVIRMRLGAKAPTARMQTHAAQAVQDIDAIVERSAMVIRIDDKPQPLQYVPCRLDELLIEIRSQQQAARRITLNLAENSIDISVNSDPVFLRMVLSNLLDNAVKYSPSNGLVKIHMALETRGARNGVNVQIENLVGPAGLPDIAYIYKKYYRAPGAHGHSGSGLGLYIVKTLTEQLGATIECRPQAGLMIFILWLPL